MLRGRQRHVTILIGIILVRRTSSTHAHPVAHTKPNDPKTLLTVVFYTTNSLWKDYLSFLPAQDQNKNHEDEASNLIGNGKPEPFPERDPRPIRPYVRPPRPPAAQISSATNHTRLVPAGEGKENATLLMLARNSDIDGVLSSIEQLERRFNKRFGYPWVFLNEVEFDEEFKSRVKEATSSSVEFGVIPYDDWYPPEWIDEEKAMEGRTKLQDQRIIYAGVLLCIFCAPDFVLTLHFWLLDSVPYRNMCRFNSGFFFRHPLMQPYKYYWRVEPNISYTCDITYDPFEYLRVHDKIYGPSSVRYIPTFDLFMLALRLCL
ncbi:hypothetical protein PQX77_021754 [Marasmius sp. AFHP31]|nr:hypothetical protein PQX77_021754 [Marasmius sp. AFHP31]